jgi:non-ribosomal peptide synthetase component F
MIGPDDLTARLRQLAREHGLTVKSVLLAAHCLALRLLTGARDITSGVITHGRPELEDTERIVGMFLNIMPIRLNDQPGDSWIATAQEAFRQEREGHAHRHYPFGAIQRDQRGRVCESVLNYVHFYQLTEVVTTPGIRLLDLRTWEITNMALVVTAVTDPADNRIWLRIDCDAHALGSDQADILAKGWLEILRRMTESPDEPAELGSLATGT